MHLCNILGLRYIFQDSPKDFFPTALPLEATLPPGSITIFSVSICVFYNACKLQITSRLLKNCARRPLSLLRLIHVLFG